MFANTNGIYAVLSPPSRGRGSKPDAVHDLMRHREVAPFAGAWIETSTPTSTDAGTRSPPFGGVDRNVAAYALIILGVGRPLRGGVDRNNQTTIWAANLQEGRQAAMRSAGTTSMVYVEA